MKEEQLKILSEKLELDKILNKVKSFCFSDSGKDLCDITPFYTDATDLNYELNKVQEMKDLILIEGGLELNGLKDIRKILHSINIDGYFIPADKLLWILDFIKIVKNVKSKINSVYKANSERYKLLYELSSNLFYDKSIEYHIESTIDENGLVRDSASLNLKKIRSEIYKKSEHLRKTLNKILNEVSDQDLVRDDIISIRDGRLVIPVKIENKRKVPGIIHSTSASGVTVFIEPSETIEMNNELTELQYEEKREIERILRELTRKLSENYNELIKNVEIISELDFLYAKAKYAIEINASKPEFHLHEINLIDAYHPLLLEQLKKENVVPLNFHIDEKSNTIIITGPNAGGKTVALKTIGLLQLMLQKAIFVPCSPDSKFRIFNKIFISIGDEQSIEQNLSSFSSHLKHIKEILDEADSDSLVLIDEICSGTDPKSGSALAESILENLTERNAITIVTTHIGELKILAQKNPKIKNASLEFDVNTISPNYHFVMDVPGHSFTFEIAKKYQLPDDIINNAKNLVGTQQIKLDEIILDLEKEKQIYRDLRKKYDVENSKVEGLKKLYETKISELKKREKEEIKKAEVKVSEIISNANKLIENTIKEIREAEKLDAKKIKSQFSKEAEKIIKEVTSKTNSELELKESFSVNDVVVIKDTNSKGIVLEIEKDSAKVDVNGMILKVKLSDLKLCESDSKDTRIPRGEKVDFSFLSNVNRELDIRGMYPYEIEGKIEEFLNDAIIHNLPEVRIIHGKGTGKLRAKVHDVLKKSKVVKSFRFGNWNEGDSGITIVEL
ncbi:MAG: endonuclease MutS2 [Ignavibacteria bacterium]|nr:endonuclease MutS2 [Ignavibacteria bacterium]